MRPIQIVQFVVAAALAVFLAMEVGDGLRIELQHRRPRRTAPGREAP